LSRSLGLGARVACAIAHFRHETARLDDRYRHAVYGGAGLDLWSAEAMGVRFAITLRDSHVLRHEGPLSVALTVDSSVVHVIAFAWVPGHMVIADCAEPWLM